MLIAREALRGAPCLMDSPHASAVGRWARSSSIARGRPSGHAGSDVYFDPLAACSVARVAPLVLHMVAATGVVRTRIGRPFMCNSSRTRSPRPGVVSRGLSCPMRRFGPCAARDSHRGPWVARPGVWVREAGMVRIVRWGAPALPAKKEGLRLACHLQSETSSARALCVCPHLRVCVRSRIHRDPPFQLERHRTYWQGLARGHSSRTALIVYTCSDALSRMNSRFAECGVPPAQPRGRTGSVPWI